MFASLRSKLFASYIFLVVLCLLVVGLAAGLLISKYQHDAQVRSLHSQAIIYRTFIDNQLKQAVKQTNAVTLDKNLRSVANLAGIRMMIVANSGKVLEDSVSGADNLQGKDFAPQPGSILPPTLGLRTRYLTDPNLAATTADGKYLYVAAEINPPAGVNARYFVVMTSPANAWAELLFPLFIAGLVALLLSLLIAWLLGRNISRPLHQISLAANRIAQGDYSQRIQLDGEDEVALLGQNFNIMASEVQRTQQAQRDFLANMSHDLKTPLTSIQGFSQAVLDGTLPDLKSAQGAARVINDEALRMGRLVNALLELSRLQSGQVQMHPQPLDPGELLHATVDSLQPQAAAHDISLGQNGLVGLPQIMGDPDRLRQVFTNLVDNAIKHTPVGGWVQVEAHIAQAAHDHAPSSIVITIADSGEGIPAADLPRIFERFYQVEKSRSSDGRGLGLGLAISKEIIEAHQGSIAVSSELGKGTIFTIALPTIGALANALTLQLRAAPARRT
jgi:signal transduction histidine kinase